MAPPSPAKLKQSWGTSARRDLRCANSVGLAGEWWAFAAYPRRIHQPETVSNPEQPFRIAMRYSFPVRGADWQPVEKSAALRHRLIRMIRRKHDAIDADLKHEFEELGRKLKPENV